MNNDKDLRFWLLMNEHAPAVLVFISGVEKDKFRWNEYVSGSIIQLRNKGTMKKCIPVDPISSYSDASPLSIPLQFLVILHLTEHSSGPGSSTNFVSWSTRLARPPPPGMATLPRSTDFIWNNDTLQYFVLTAWLVHHWQLLNGLDTFTVYSCTKENLSGPENTNLFPKQ